MAQPTRRTSLVMYGVIRPEGVAASIFSSPSLPTYQVVAEVPTFFSRSPSVPYSKLVVDPCAVIETGRFSAS